MVQALGREVEQAHPFALVHQILEGLVRTEGVQARGLTRSSRSLRSLLQRSVRAAELPARQESPARSEMVDALYCFLASLSEVRPLLACLERRPGKVFPREPHVQDSLPRR